MGYYLQKRAETMEYFKRLVLNPRKPFNLSTHIVNMHHLMIENETKNGKKNVIGKEETIILFKI